MIIAAIIPVGDLRLNGYGNVFEPCLRSVSEFADVVYIVQSLPAKKDLVSRVSSYNNVKVLSGAGTWFENGKFDGEQINRNIGIAESEAWLCGATVALVMSSNWYIPHSSRVGLYKRLQSVKDWGYIYRGNQLAGQLFSASKRLPMVVKLGGKFHHKFLPEKTGDGTTWIEPERGDFRGHDGEMIVDAPFEMAPEDLENKMNFCRCYSDVLPKRSPVFDWDYWHKYYRAKMQDWEPLDVPLDEYGREIAQASKPDYLSRMFLRELLHAPA